MNKDISNPTRLTNTALYLFAFTIIAIIAGIVFGIIVDANPNKKVYAEVFVALAGYMIGGIISTIGFAFSIVALVKEKKIVKGIIALSLHGAIVVPMILYFANSYAHNRARQEQILIREERLRIDVKELASGVKCEYSSNKDTFIVKGKYAMKIDAIDVCLRDLLDRIEEFQSKPSYQYIIEVEGPTNYRLTLNYEDMGHVGTLNRIAKFLPGWWEVDYRQKSHIDKTENGPVRTKRVILKRVARE